MKQHSKWLSGPFWQVKTHVIAVPASVQSDLPLIEQTLGYDTACKLYSSIVGNLSIQVAFETRS